LVGGDGAAKISTQISTLVKTRSLAHTPNNKHYCNKIIAS